MSVSALDFGTTHAGQPTHLYRLKNARGMEVDVTDLGASIVAVRVPAASGTLVDVALGFDEVARYEHNAMGLGGTLGRCANRIADAAFELEGARYALTANAGPHAMHGGRSMWFERLWDGALIGRKGERRKGAHADTVIFGLLSRDGDQGFPGDVDVRVTYKLTDDNELHITYDAQPGLQTVVNLSNSTFWNLDGHDSGSVLDHTLWLAAQSYLPTDETRVPNGIVAGVGGTPFDFREPKALGRDLGDRLDDYDHNVVFGGDRRHRQHVATLTARETGITMDVHTDMPGMQVRTARELNVEGAKDGAHYGPHAGVALSTQFAPDAIHHPAWEQPVFSPEHPFHSRTTYAFGLA